MILEIYKFFQQLSILLILIATRKFSFFLKDIFNGTWNKKHLIFLNLEITYRHNRIWKNWKINT